MAGLKLLFGVLSRFAPNLGSRLAFYVWFRPRFFARSDWSKAAPDLSTDQVESFSFSLNGKEVRGVIAGGDGPSVILVHGWGGCMNQFSFLADQLLSKGYQVCLVDLPAHGTSSGNKTNLFEMTEALAWVGREIVRPDFIIAHSAGAVLACRAMRLGLNVPKVVLMAPPNRFSAMIDKVGRVVGFSKQIGELLRKRIEKEFAAEIWDELSVGFNAQDLPGEGLIIHDRHDIEVPIAEGREIAQAWSNAQVFTTAGLGHYQILSSEHVFDTIYKYIS